MSLPSKFAATSLRKAAEFAAAEAKAANAPKTVLSIPSVVRFGPLRLSEIEAKEGRKPGAVVRQVGAIRRIFLLEPHLTADELDGLAYRIKMFARNQAINSIFLANNHKTVAAEEELTDEEILAPMSLLELEQRETDLDILGIGNPDVYLAGGYDARSLVDADAHEKSRTLDALTKLSKAVRGSPDQKSENASKIPFVTVAHGLINDGGYALAMGSFAMATAGSSFRIMNPLRGLSLDPIGFSYILPRLGREYAQHSAKYPVGSVLALTGYECDGHDMVETGLATHYMNSHRKLATLERALSEFLSFEQQALVPEPVKTYGLEDRPAPSRGGYRPYNVNGKFRNVTVSTLMMAASDYDALGQNLTPYRPGLDEYFFDDDPSLVLNSEKNEVWGERNSMLMTIATTFQNLFEREKSIVTIMEQMREYANAEATNEEEKEFVDVAKKLYEGMKAQSPLALAVTHRIMKIGKTEKESLESCVKREKRVQMKLLEGEDFINWAKSGVKEGEFKDWKHKDVKDVSADEVEELLSPN